MKLIILIAFSYLLIEFLNRKSNDSTDKTDGEKVINKGENVLKEEKDVTKESSYASRHTSTPEHEKAAEEIVVKNEKIAREAIRKEEARRDERENPSGDDN